MSRLIVGHGGETVRAWPNADETVTIETTRWGHEPVLGTYSRHDITGLILQLGDAAGLAVEIPQRRAA